jgi:hypothetical protein
MTLCRIPGPALDELKEDGDAAVHFPAYPLEPIPLKGQSHEKVGEMSVWGISLGPN